MIQIKIEDMGKWLAAQRKIKVASAALPAVFNKMVHREAEFFRAKVIDGLKGQAPGGTKFKKSLSPWTEATRKYLGVGGTKTLIVNGDLINGIVVKAIAGGWFVGITPGSVNSKGMSLLKIATINEEGVGEGTPHPPIWVPIKPGMILKLLEISKFMGKTRDKQGRFTSEYVKRGLTRAGWIGINIPARPFLQPVWDRYSKKTTSKARWAAVLAELAAANFW